VTRAVVFAYHDVGVRCLSVLLEHGVEVPLVVTHEDDPQETIWFQSVAELARRHGIPAITPLETKDPALATRIASLSPDFLFSFYYRRLIPRSVLRLAPRGALNMHGSLLPKYRGRAPVNWAIVNGETVTGATLHYMEARADAGAIVGREAVPILPDETAHDVFNKVTAAAGRLLDRTLPALVDGTAVAVPQVEAEATTFPGRKPEDGRIDWARAASSIHNLVRAVAPPYPGAFTLLRGKTVFIHRTRRAPTPPHRAQPRHLYGENGACYAVCGDGGTIELLAATVDLRALARDIDGQPLAL